MKPIIQKTCHLLGTIVVRLLALGGISFAMTAAILSWPLLSQTEPYEDFHRAAILACAVLFSASCIVLLASSCLHAMVTLLGIGSRSRSWCAVAILIGLGIVLALTLVVRVFQSPFDYIDLKQISLPLVFTVTGLVVLVCGVGAGWVLLLVEREKPSQWLSGSD